MRVSLAVAAAAIEDHEAGYPQVAAAKLSVATEVDIKDQQTGSSQSTTPEAATRQVSANDTEPDEEVVAVCAGEKFMVGLGHVLERWVEHTSSEVGRKTTHFHSSRKPPMSIKDYLRRLHKYFVCSDESYVLALVFIDRLGKADPSMIVCELNVHRLLMIAVMVAVKFHDDVYYSNAYYAKVGGLPLKEVNLLEARLIALLDWNLFVDPGEYQLYHSLVCQATYHEDGLEHPS